MANISEVKGSYTFDFTNVKATGQLLDNEHVELD